MKKKDILELKRRLKKDDCTFTKMCGCYVNGEKNVILNFKETFLNLEDIEFHKYLEIARKTLSGTIGNNILKLEFPTSDFDSDSTQQFLFKLSRSELKDDSLIEEFYKSIIDNYEYTGNFLILLFADAYDVMTKTSDNSKLDESEEVYQYVLCAVCPVTLSKPGLGYLEDKNRIGARLRDWVVGAPDLGFVYPAFSERSADVNSVMYYTKNAKDPHPEFMEYVLGCPSKTTATEQKEALHTIIKKAVNDDEEKSEHLIMEIQENLNNIVEEHAATSDKDSEPVTLKYNDIQDVLIENGISEEITEKVEKSYIKEFGETAPVVEQLLDSKLLKANEQRKKEERLEKKVKFLQEELDKTKNEVSADVNEDTEENLDEILDNIINDDKDDYDVILKVNPEKVDQIKSQIIDGQKCIIIPIEEDEKANVNGVTTKL